MTSSGEPAGPDPTRVRPFLDALAPATGAGAGGADAPGTERGSEPGAGPGPSDRPRPFVLTSGRVDGADPYLDLETQVSARRPPPPWAPPVAGLAPELQRIIALCATPLSVAEISARVPLHLGVTKILVGDLRAAGHLDVHELDESRTHDPDTILRVIRGLRALT